MAWTKPLAYAAGVGLVALVGSPIRQNRRPLQEREDDFPLSYYPMFSAKRGPVGTVHHLIGIDANGGEHILRHTLAGHGGLNQVRRQITRTVRERRSRRLARRVARRVATSSDPLLCTIEHVQVVTSKHRYDDFFAGDRTPVSRKIRAEVPVLRLQPS